MSAIIRPVPGGGFCGIRSTAISVRPSPLKSPVVTELMNWLFLLFD